MDAFKLLVPEMVQLFRLRYQILRYVSVNEPVGRRVLSSALKQSERTIRNETEQLTRMGYLSSSKLGVSLTAQGEEVLIELEPLANSMNSAELLEKKLEERLGIERCIIVDGNYDTDIGKHELGKATSNYLVGLLEDDSIVGVTGGTTMRVVAKSVSAHREFPDVMIVPARGGVGKAIDTQANSIASVMAKNLGAKYTMVNLPDSVDTKTLDSLMKLPDVAESLHLLSKIDILVFGVGRADKMGKRRNVGEDAYERLLSQGAVAEAFGNYFDIQGKIVLGSDSIGIKLDHYMKIPKVIAVAGGADKAEAIIAITKLRSDMTLVTNIECAEEILYHEV